MMLQLWGLLAGATAVLNEYLYRTLPGPWHEYLWIWVPTQLTISYAIYRLVTAPGATLLDALVVFTFSTALVRVLVSLFVLRDDIAIYTWAAFGLLLLARIIQHWGKA